MSFVVLSYLFLWHYMLISVSAPIIAETVCQISFVLLMIGACISISMASTMQCTKQFIIRCFLVTAILFLDYHRSFFHQVMIFLHLTHLPCFSYCKPDYAPESLLVHCSFWVCCHATCCMGQNHHHQCCFHCWLLASSEKANAAVPHADPTSPCSLQGLIQQCFEAPATNNQSMES